VAQKCQRPENPQHNNLKLLCCENHNTKVLSCCVVGFRQHKKAKKNTKTQIFRCVVNVPTTQRKWKTVIKLTFYGDVEKCVGDFLM